MASVFNPYRVTFGFKFSTCSLKLLSSHVKPKGHDLFSFQCGLLIQNQHSLCK
ncbi:unnamed protein product [Arabidopsis lyrata]|uniref:Predicted protein n=1 Tax=Arabidopsis lyrata subsp. lyrata TaxID=81972 RepID=D7MTH8_ARALL|nr:predicted protein [Arabidopsis lyrata subsp. lyrata]CAH8278729.1 unnamed protein product [Arabidopsis lyrata]